MTLAGAPNDTIFIAIAAYREPELRLTIESCIAQACRPDRLRFGVCVQSDDDPLTQPESLDGVDAEIRVLAYDWTDSKGGCWARHLAQGLYRGERYTMQIDSHMRMAAGWDETLIDMMGRCPSDKPLITTICPLYGLVDGQDCFDLAANVPITLIESFDEDGWVRHRITGGPEESVLRATRWLSGMFVFTLGQWNVEVRQDPEHLYTGEEFALAIRSFTWGYDLFSPTSVVAWHRLHPEPNAKFIFQGEQREVSLRQDRALRRLRVLHGGDSERLLAPYSAGPHRTVAEYREWSGLDYATLTVSDDARHGVAPAAFTPSW